eukprot:comp9995_c0_seq1/m.4872 comp9995_c0_seq1/g.4872  ORF comp9995_c0_seq1/g.4872 comp9995_c0_seq1/m.4872 type:complete len:594 (-) comp9995_c0_seq1:69-1850(-)
MVFVLQSPYDTLNVFKMNKGILAIRKRMAINRHTWKLILLVIVLVVTLGLGLSKLSLSPATSFYDSPLFNYSKAGQPEQSTFAPWWNRVVSSQPAIPPSQQQPAMRLGACYFLDPHLQLNLEPHIGDWADGKRLEVGQAFNITITKTCQLPDTEDELYVKIISTNMRQVARVHVGKQRCLNHTVADRDNELMTPQNIEIGENEFGPREEVVCEKNYTISFIPYEAGMHTFVLRVFLQDVPTLLYNQSCSNVNCTERTAKYRTHEDGTLAVFSLMAADSRFSRDQDLLSNCVQHGQTVTLNYTGLQRGVWVRKSQAGRMFPEQLLYSSISDNNTANVTESLNYWSDSFIWMPQAHMNQFLYCPIMDVVANMKRQSQPEDIASALKAVNISKMFIAGDSITRELYADLAMLLAPPNITFEYGDKWLYHHQTTNVIENAPTLDFRFQGYICSSQLKPPGNGTGQCWGADVIIIDHGLWSVYQHTPAETLQSLETCMLKVIAKECGNVIRRGRAYFLSMPATSNSNFLRIPHRVRHVNAATEQLVARYGFKMVDTYHWSHGRPEGNDDGDHYGYWSGSPLYLSRTTVDLLLSDLLAR